MHQNRAFRPYSPFPVHYVTRYIICADPLFLGAWRVYLSIKYDVMNHIKQAKDLGESLRREREQQNLTQIKLALEAHVEQKIISRLENGLHNSTLDSLLNICAVLHLRVIVVRE